MSDPSRSGPPPNPLEGRQRHLVMFLQIGLVLVAALGELALIVPDPHRRPIAIAMVVVLIAVPVGRVAWLGIRWARRRDWRFAAAAAVLLAVLASGLLLTR